MKKIIDGNEACAISSYYFTELAGIYPITPSSPMAEKVDEMSTKGVLNFLDKPVKVTQMQSEAGAAALVHGALQGGVLASTYTSSQGLLLMIPTLYKAAGEGIPLVLNVAARSLATHSLSIMGDHQDVYSVRSTGIAMLASSSVQDAHYLGAVAHLSAIDASMPMLHFFDGFRTSHELNSVDVLEMSELKPLINMDAVNKFKQRSLLNSVRTSGTSEGDDVYFQNTEARNKDYDELPHIINNYMVKINELTGKSYAPFVYHGDPSATKIIVAMGSVNNTIKEYLKINHSGIGLIEVHLYRPFSPEYLLKVLPSTVTKVAVLDKTKEAGSNGEPLFLDVLSVLSNKNIKVVGGRFGLSGKNTDLSHIASVYEYLTTDNLKTFTIGITDDVTNLSLEPIPVSYKKPYYEIACYGFGSDGTVTASKTILKSLGQTYNVQGYFQYDSSKSGGITKSHLRFGKTDILASYYVNQPMAVMINRDAYLKNLDVFDGLIDQGLVLVNTNLNNDAFNALLSNDLKQKLKGKFVYLIDADKIATSNGLGNKISTIMTLAFFRVSNLIEYSGVYQNLVEDIKKTFYLKGETIINNNINALKEVEANIRKVEINDVLNNLGDDTETMYEKIANFKGDSLKVSDFTEYKTGDFKTEAIHQNNISKTCPKWDGDNCIQCARCSLVCPHAAIRPVLLNKADVEDPELFKEAIGNSELLHSIMINQQQCTGCGLCVKVCPGKGGNKALVLSEELDPNLQAVVLKYFNKTNEKPLPLSTVKGTQLNKPLFEYSKACAGCGETPYVKLLTQIVGDKLVIANATGCSSIYGGSVPYFPYSISWMNSLFEDNAEFAMGIKLAAELSGSDKSIWAVGGDGWAYDIGFAGIDQVLASGINMNILILDTEVYSNTGGQMSKSSRSGALAKFASSGKNTNKKDLAAIAMTYENVYIAAISLGGNMNQAIRAINEAMAFDGPSLIIAYSPCIAHGIAGGLGNSIEEEKLAVEVGYWPIYRYQPSTGLVLDMPEPNFDNYASFLNNERRYAMLKAVNPEHAEELLEANKQAAISRYQKLKEMTKKAT